MTEQDIREQLLVLGATTGRDVADLETVPLGELLLQLEAYQGAAADREPTAFDQAVLIVEQLARIAGPLATIAGAITSGVTVAKGATS